MDWLFSADVTSALSWALLCTVVLCARPGRSDFAPARGVAAAIPRGVFAAFGLILNVRMRRFTN